MIVCSRKGESTSLHRAETVGRRWRWADRMEFSNAFEIKTSLN